MKKIYHLSFFALFVVMATNISYALVNIKSTDYVLDYNCSTYLYDGHLVKAFGYIHLETLEGKLDYSIQNPNDYNLAARFKMKLKLSEKNTKLIKKSNSLYQIKDYFKPANLELSLTIPMGMNETMGTLIANGESFEVYCEKSIIQADEYDPSDHATNL